MGTTLCRGWLAALALAAATLPGGHALAQGRCDEACLSKLGDDYLSALAARDPAKLPTAPEVRVTENGQTMRLGEGLWATATGLGDFRMHFNDVDAGQAGVMAVVLEHGFPDILTARMKVVDSKVTEIESQVVRGELAGLTKIDALHADPTFDTPLAPADRRSRADMVATMNLYMKAISTPAPNPAIFDPHCVRIENGELTAGDPKGAGLAKLSCGDQLSQLKQHTIEIRDARYPIVDTKRGVVFVVMFFDYSAAAFPTPPTPTAGAPKPKRGFGADPFTFMNAEEFKLVGGRVTLIQASVLPVPYKMAPGWPS